MKGKVWKTLVLLGVCVGLGVRYGIRHGWLAGHTYWVTEKSVQKGISKNFGDRPNS